MILYSPSQKAHFPPSKKDKTWRGKGQQRHSRKHASSFRTKRESRDFNLHNTERLAHTSNNRHCSFWKSEESGKTPNTRHLNSQQATPPYCKKQTLKVRKPKQTKFFAGIYKITASSDSRKTAITINSTSKTSRKKHKTPILSAFLRSKTKKNHIFFKIFFKILARYIFLIYLCTIKQEETTILLKLKPWRGGRVVDCTGLENRRTERYRGFESLSLRRNKPTRYWFSIL